MEVGLGGASLFKVDRIVIALNRKVKGKHFFIGPPGWLIIGQAVDVLSPIDGIWYGGMVCDTFEQDGSHMFHVKYPKHEREEYKWEESKLLYSIAHD